MKNRHLEYTTIAVSGYYGFGSIGDEAVLRSILFGISETLPGSCVFVLCNKTAALPAIPNIRLFPVSRSDPFSIVSAFIKSDIFISGGGSLLQDATSSKSLSYYCTLIHLAKLLGCKVFVFANGIGPLKNTKMCKKALSVCDLISVRDADSYALARSLTDDRIKTVLTADPIFAHTFSRRPTPLPSFVSSEKPFFALSLRRCANGKSIDRSCVCEFIFQQKKKGLTPVFIPMQDSYDLELCRDISEHTGGVLATVYDEDSLFCILEKAAFAVGMRLHFLITAAIAGIPTVALSYDAKVTSCISPLKSGSVLPAFGITASDLSDATLKARAAFSRQDLEEKLAEQKRLANINLSLLLSLAGREEERAGDDQKFFADT